MSIFEIISQGGEKVLVAVEVIRDLKAPVKTESQETAMKIFHRAFPNTPIKSCHFVETI